MPPRSHPHPLTLFSLVPLNQRAHDIVNHSSNSHMVSTLPEGKLALDIGFHIRPRSRNTLATLGRSADVDIFVEGSSIAKTQCSFEIDDPTTGVVMLYDRSHLQTTQVFGENVKPFELGRVRRVVVARNVNTEFGIGGQRGNLARFGLEWCNEDDVMRNIKIGNEALSGQVENPRSARTVDDRPTALPSRPLTRIHTPGETQLRIRYIQGHPLGSGQFGEVYKAIDVDTGKAMAVKVMKRPLLGMNTEMWQCVKREVEILAGISHVSFRKPLYYRTIVTNSALSPTLLSI